jgi:GTP pyrophosphokinase
VRGKYESRLHYIERAAPVVKRHLQDAGVQVLDIHARAKRMWSLYQKLKRYDMNPDKVLDLVALRIIVPDIKSCYEALGVIHAHYPPMPGRIKDYIALPKPNGYRSLHTTVFCEKGQVAEIQIRTPEMHDHAENGVASHWAYKENKKNGELAWVNQLKNVLRGIKTSQGMADLKIDFFKNRIFVLTPHGDVKDLPEGATPVDFAYAVHSEIGNRMTGAIVNGKLEPLDHVLQSGDVVEIMKSKEPKPSKGWLRFVKTTQAEKHIRSWFKRHESLPEVEPRETPEVQPRKMHRKGQKPRVATAAAAPTSGVPLIGGQSGLHYRLGKCCSPAAGSPIVGYLTVSRGVTVHTADCANIRAVDARRLLEASWG